MEAITILQDKRIVLAVTGSIAVYKAVDLASKLTQAGVLVDVIMTTSAQKFVTPLTFQAVTGRPVYTDLWQTDNSGGLQTHIAHVGLAEYADLMAVIPATAHTIARLTHGFADDLLTITALASRCPLLIAPAMDGSMYEHHTTRTNVEALEHRGVVLIEPETGRFASGLVGRGRLPETATLMGYIRQVIGHVGRLAGKKVIISAGGTREAIDPVRYISNYSSGKQGYALAQAAVDAGAKEVILVSTRDDLPVPIGVTRVPVDSAQEMQNAILTHSEFADVLVMAAAVADFRPVQIATQKIKKQANDNGLRIDLAPNADILLEVKKQRARNGLPRVTVGFAAESQDLVANAERKLQKKGLDFIVANDITASDAGFAVDNNRAVIIDRDGVHPLDLISKTRLSEHIMTRIATRLESP